MVLRKDCGPLGTLEAELHEFPTDSTSRVIVYSFRVTSAGGGDRREVGKFEYGDPTPPGSGEPTTSLLDAELTPPDVLVEVFINTLSELENGIGYSAYVQPLEGSAIDVPGTAFTPSVYQSAPGEPRRRAQITGSIPGKDLTLSLIGPHDVLRFRFVFWEPDIGWRSLPGNKPPQPPIYMAPDLRQ